MSKSETLNKDEKIQKENLDVIGQNRFLNKEVQKTLKIRLASTSIMLILLFAYLLSGILFTTFKYQKLELIDLSAYFNMLCSSVIIGFASYEMNKMFKIRSFWQHFLILFFGLFLFIIPTSEQAYRFGFYIELNETIYSPFSGMHQLVFWMFTFLIFSIIFVIGIARKTSEAKYVVFNAAMQIFIVFAFKMFTILMLSQTEFSLNFSGTENEIADLGTIAGGKGTYSYNTVCWIWLMVILGDSFAYLGGLRFGKTPLAPKISPKKTWEGALIGFACATLIGIIYVIAFWFLQENTLPLFSLMQKYYDTSYSWVAWVIILCIAIIIPIWGLIGDLIFSYIKRKMGVKDFSKLIPGHGGILDRLDSFIFVLAVLFLMIGFI